MPTWMLLVVGGLSVAVTAIVLFVPRSRSTTDMASQTLDFMDGRRRAPYTRRPPGRSNGLELSLRNGRSYR